MQERETPVVDQSGETSNCAETIFRKIAGGFCFLIAFFGILILIKTELRKWFIMGGDPSPANIWMFWISLGGAVLFGFVGSKLWPKKVQSPDE